METNNDKAKRLADAVDQEIIKTLQLGKSFLVEAGAGSGKTYSLLRVVDWLQANRRSEYRRRQQQVACITYTNVAVDEIARRLSQGSFIEPSTIHSFAWRFISSFQSALVKTAKQIELFPKDDTSTTFSSVSYTLGVREIKNGCLYLHHNDVITLFSHFLNNAKFRAIIAHSCPIILIDEYQDCFDSIMDKFLKHYIEEGTGPQFGLFGDGWQTIYASSGACGEIKSSHLKIIKKESNFRSQQVIVDVLNAIRPHLPQVSASDEQDGEVIVITTDEYRGGRQAGYYKDELPNEVLNQYVDEVQKKLQSNGWVGETKVLMLTHKLLARQQGYDNLLDFLDTSLKQQDEPHLLFFADMLEPLYKAIKASDVRGLYETLGIKRRPIQTKREKTIWPTIGEQLDIARNRTIGDVMSVAVSSELIPIPPQVLELFRQYERGKTITYKKGTLGDLYAIEYSEVVRALEFFKPDSTYSTQHGVKGEGYDNVLVVLGRGWSNYKFDEYLHRDESELSGDELKAYIRNRNLFYVCCSRAKKRLALLITVPTNSSFRAYLHMVFGEERMVEYSRFVDECVGI